MEITLRVIDLFCGAGGFSEGFRQAGFDVIWAVDKWKPAITTHEKNHPQCKAILDDVERIAFLTDEEFEEVVPDSEVIIGSPPCVDFSSSNKSGKGDKSLGIVLIESFLRIVARKKFKKGSILKYWILENVPNSQKYIKEEYTAKDLGLPGDFILKTRSSSAKIYSAQHYGSPSKRLRFICGDFPEPQQTVTSDAEFMALKYILGHLGNPKEPSNMVILDPNYGFEMLASEITDHHYIQEYAKFEWEQAKRLKEDKGYMGKMSFPENLDKPSRTIMATLSASARESMILPYKKDRYRAATIREVACLMSFPLDYQFFGNSVGTKYRLVGNAVPPKLANALAKAIAKKENLSTPKKYIKHKTSTENNDFVNLNGTVIPIKKEKNKRSTARFKYHIPYMIIDSYRVELTNHVSDFNSLRFKWAVEIHKSQGASAKIFTPQYPETVFSIAQQKRADAFIKKHHMKIKTSNNLQKAYCLTEHERLSKDLIGPIDLLNAVRKFIDSLNLSEHDYQLTRKNKVSASVTFPLPILAGYYILSKIIGNLTIK